MDFQQSQTYQNLQNAYNVELNNSTTFSIYGDRARQEGYNEIGNYFDTVTRNEKEHARIWLRQLNNGELPTTAENLRYSSEVAAATGNEMYRDYARIAREEGYDDIAALFNGVANIDLNHNTIFQRLYGEVETDTVFCKERETLWICMQCGNIMSGLCAPEICPVCGFPQAFYRQYFSETD
ncbi:MAG: hypothetical protein K0S76_2994 [Herbinix sp.]|jgi:rubrerythrin|nr:hypothetical protein [Herbinix sp.]